MKDELDERFDASSEPSTREIVRLAARAGVGLWAADAEDRFRYVNRAAAAVLGDKPGALAGRLISDFFFEEDLTTLAARLVRRRAGAPEQFEQRIRNLDGRARWIWVAAVPRFDAARRYVGAAGMLLDVTARRDAEEALALHTAALQSDVSAVVITDTEGTIEWVNAAFTALTGWAAAEVVGRHSRVLGSGVHGPEFYGDLWNTIRAGQRWHGELVNRRADGSLYEEELSVAPVRSADGVIRHYVAVKQDVTPRNRAAQKIRAQAAILDRASDLIAVHDDEGRIRFWSEGARRLLGWSPEAATGRRIHALLGVHQTPEVEASFERLRRDGRLTMELEVGTLDGRRLWLSGRWSRLGPEGAGEILWTAFDATELRRLRADAIRAQRLDSLGHLAGGVAHDLNNLLVPISTAADLLRPEQLSRDGRETVELLADTAKAASELVRQLLSFARGSGGEREPVQVAEVLGRVARLVERTFPSEVKVVVDATVEAWVVGGATQLHQVLLNLCLNARDAMPAGGTLTLGASQVEPGPERLARAPGASPGSFVGLHVRDTGTGIAPEHLEHVFEPLFTTKAPGHGTGLGLSTVFQIVRGHGGFVEVDTTPGVGTEFRVYLPRIERPTT